MGQSSGQTSLILLLLQMLSATTAINTKKRNINKVSMEKKMLDGKQLKPVICLDTNFLKYFPNLKLD